MLCPTNDELAWVFATHLGELQRNFNLATPPPETLLRLLDKGRLHEACGLAGLATMPSWFPGTEEELDEPPPELAFPVVVKPRTQLFHGTRSKGGVATGPRSLRAHWRRLARIGCNEPGLRQSSPELAGPFVQQYGPVATEGVLSLSGFVDRTGEAFVVRASRKVVLRPMELSVGVWFEAASVDSALAEAVRLLCRQTGYFGVFEAEFVRWEGQPRLIDFNPRFYGEMGFDQARGLPLAQLAYLNALGDEEGARKLALASMDDRPVRPYLHRFALGLERAASNRRVLLVSPDLVAAPADGAGLDFTRDSDDPWPARLDNANIVAGYLRHPRSVLRLFRSKAQTS